MLRRSGRPRSVMDRLGDNVYDRKRKIQQTEIVPPEAEALPLPPSPSETVASPGDW